MAWFNGASTINPGAGLVLVDTGPLYQGVFDLVVAIDVSVQTTVLLELRDATNAVTLKSRELRLAGARYHEKFEGVDVVSGQRLRVSTVGAFVGTIEADLFTVTRYDIIQSASP